ncbi:DUF4956 domain-containing protein [Hydrogenoanaerobacterium saccharovorans]|uniref:DUF4956 domain-containing protein n=1 Tax=Hydrogenoanaerobacterium saccharovorans TaxID=474960 RepID=A0ABS2GLX2_9FIRM|nr:DUF4956 domain-containing protein [Hydrogenoanaerobacterium saccharovorans]MBM6922544.1 DUF4956 domain-containing protein [Hydrogenoanaerobacterium saccharovorans]HIY81838.1 DUF4956 domain-containing protein [Bacillota bacterium]
MIDNLFRGLFDTDMTVIITPAEFLTCLGVSLGIGLILAALYQYHTRYTRSFVVTLALLPAVVCVVIMMVNGNVGTGVAVAGTFSLVRFRSAPGTAREICAIFLAMAAGLIAGMGYLGYAVLCTLVLGGAELLFRMLSAKADGGASLYKTLHITIPEDLDYSDVFDEPLREFTREYELTSVKTTNMGSLFRLTYNITLRDSRTEKSLIDRLRCRNGNLEITVSKQETAIGEL